MSPACGAPASSPASLCRSPARTSSRLVLPAPLRPQMCRASPGATVKLKSRRIARSPRTTSRLRATMDSMARILEAGRPRVAERQLLREARADEFGRDADCAKGLRVGSPQRLHGRIGPADEILRKTGAFQIRALL